MRKKTPPAWQFPALIGTCVVGLGAIGTFIVKSASYIQLPDKVEAAVQKNAEQDKALDKLTAIQETWQKIYQQQQAPNQPAPRVWWEKDQDGNAYCTDGTRSWWPTEGRCD